MSWRRLIYVVLKASNLRRLEDVWFTMSSRRLIYDVLRTSDLRRLEDVLFTSSWRSSIYNIFKTSVKQCLCSNVVLTFIQHQKKWFLLILYCLKYSENFKCLGYYLGMKFCRWLRFFNPSWRRFQWTGFCMIGTYVTKELTTLNNKFAESEVKKENKFSRSRNFDFPCIHFNIIKKVASSWLIKKKLRHRYFPVNFEKLLKTPILKN